MNDRRCGALSAEYDADGNPITYVCLLPAGHDDRGEPAGETLTK
jgi:hypothetical protein